ncbi:PhnA domain-containing protein [Ochrovirga pacifica]|uniref:PhnA domain-containing protein n=1 Tax=Ochrovirga pacifica TaxID=1042376 RepID=UPI0002557C0C|nr:alkylphosphonate utilization protein [Ochrovirga pacifica]
MNITEELIQRSGNKCELCGASHNLNDLKLPPSLNDTLDTNILVCGTCHDQIENPENMDANHWRCLNDAMWSEHKAVQITAWRMLQRLRNEGWPQDLLDMMYLEDADLRFAEATGEHLSDDEKIIHRDCNGALLETGDSVTMTKDKDLKGAGSFTIKRGTVIRNISLVHDNANQIEGKVNGTSVVILTKYLKKIGADQQG